MEQRPAPVINLNINWISNLRLTAMFAVVVLHTASPLLFNYKTAPLGNWMAADLYNAVTRFAVPVFVMITGALLLKKEYDLDDFLKKRLGRLILPMLFWSLVYVGYQWYNEIIVFPSDAWGCVKLVLHQLKTGSSYHLWYVYTLIGLYLFIPIIGKFVRHSTERELLYFLAIWFFTILISEPYFDRFDTAVDLHNFAGYAGYLVLGYYLANKQFNFPGFIFMVILVFLSLTVVITIGTYYLEVKTKELSTYFYEPVGPFVVPLAASAFLIAKHTTVNLSPKFMRICENAGKYTLGIYFCHALILNILELNDITYAIFNPWLSIPAVALACFLISWFLVWAMSKIPGVRVLVG